MPSSSSNRTKENKKRPLHLAIGFCLIPLVIAAMYAAPVCTTEGLFLYTTGGGVEYELDMRGYRVNGIRAAPLAEAKFDYPTPASFPPTIAALPKLLVAHFAALIILGIYSIAYLFALIALHHRKPSAERKPGDHSGIKDVAQQKGWAGVMTAVALALAVGLTAADLGCVVSAMNQLRGTTSTVEPTPMGYGLGCVAGLFSALWLVAFAGVKYSYRNTVVAQPPLDPRKYRSDGTRRQ